MKALIQQYPEQDEKFWVQYWLDIAKNGTDSLAARHLCAYLEETCWYAAKVTYREFSSPDFTESDYWQIARQVASNPVRIFNNYKAELSLPRVYAQTKLRGAILDVIRKGQETQRASDWGLLRKSSKKALKTALQMAGIGEAQQADYLLAWQGFQEVYKPPAIRRNQPLPAPTDAQLTAIADYYNQQRSPASAVNAIKIQEMLEICIKVVRKKHTIELQSLDADNRALECEVTDYSEVQQRQQETDSEQWEQITRVLSHAIASLPPTARQMLILEHGLIGLNQTEIGRAFGIKQYKVSRQLSRHKRPLLEVLAKWSENQGGITLDVEKIDALSQHLDSWLNWYCQTTILHRFLYTTLWLHPTLYTEISLLSCYYSENKNIAVIKEFQLTETQLEEKLIGIKQVLQVQLQKFFKQTLNFNLSSPDTTQPLAELVETWLQTAPYGILELERR
ncbi:sigma-70 family RNA polymerase sigma factor [Planktothrix pseudagardhii]|nr:sigma-70 family RNA polymerase sigma factor [Planktothrix pseudagardhii]